MQDEPGRRLAEALETRGFLAVVTGAGVSRASGIPTFRGAEPDAVWRTDDVEIATFDYFLRDPVGHWRWYLRRFAALDAASPNAGHRALAALEHRRQARGSRFLLVTQNIDTLHEQAGSRQLIKVHGSVDRVRCSRDGCEHGAPRGSLARSAVDFAAFHEDPSLATLPRCRRCSAFLRPHVLFFDEYYAEHADYQFERAERAAAEADRILFVGTSFSVGVTDLFLRSGLLRRVPMLSIDPTPGPSPVGARLLSLAANAEEILPAACACLGIEVPAIRNLR